MYSFVASVGIFLVRASVVLLAGDPLPAQPSEHGPTVALVLLAGDHRVLAPACLGRQVYVSPLSCVHASFAFPPSSATVPSCVVSPVSTLSYLSSVSPSALASWALLSKCIHAVCSRKTLACIMPILQTCCCQISGRVMSVAHWPPYLNG